MISLVVRTKDLLWRLTDDQDGASLVEYALLITFIAAAAFIAVVAFGGALSTEYSDIADSIP